MKASSAIAVVVGSVMLLGLQACSTNELPGATVQPARTTAVDQYSYLIGPNDSVTIFVWRNPELSGSFIVRPDGKISTSLVEDVPVAGRTPTQFARDMEKILAKYIRDPVVTVSVSGFVGPFSEQVRVIGAAAKPQSYPYRQYMTVLDLMIASGGLTEFASGNGAKLVRVKNGKQMTYDVRLDDLVRDGDISANVDILPGDIVIIPEAWF
ncbi:XrtA/PEP-CTERM system exopolysaccharide export protein [Rheinheimera sp. F8]|jgi:polysaccharide export outer membrane protein|uniref:XrtA/PEP-CTERM system exopolysaccharide export protein n=1 Tax=unclassified Rheinheimera TaxID=115860 RepID=UPI000744CA2C|nr:XrtA/PEP-CTERM system exopolysaccharide export protein [Rheinheimera sp. F8]ALZ74987.1 sugar ABC transporter substrate-binding protein [Rheinheimera sp. F8]ALZ76587.1 sugar ABC transporter substrate-binding protein [Rheinheimera sp. F8]